MKILEQALNKINPIHKKQRDFFIILIQGLIGSVGRKTFRNLSRYMQITEKTFSRQMAKAFDFVGLNAELIRSSKNDCDVLIAVQDASFISKSGKSTHGIDYFWNGSSGKAEKGLEIDTIAIVKTGITKEGYTLSTQQTPANSTPKLEKKKNKTTRLTKIDFYLDHVKKVVSKIIDLGVKHMVVDAFYAKNKYVSGVTDQGLYVIGKLRKDARLRRLYVGQQKKLGRKKKFDIGKVTIEDFNSSSVVKVDSEQIELRSCVAHSVSLDRTVKLVLIKKIVNDKKCGEALLFSTDTEIDSLTIYQFYTARFQIEFIFRDAKGFTGLGDCQSRNAQRLNYHFNSSLTALNVARLEDNLLQKKEHTQHSFSMTNWTRKYHVRIVLDRFISMFGFDQTFIKLHPSYDKMLMFGNVKH